MSSNLGTSYTWKAQYDKALKNLFQSLEISQAMFDSTQIATTLLNIGLVYYKLKDPDKALEYFDRSRQVKNMSKTKPIMINY
jgi:tetratricopeptide (TPR) repeat protein